MKRIKLTVAYDGTNYHGWQIQPNAVTVEGELNKAVSELTGEHIEVIGASRTDAGVHALGNVAVFDTESRIPGEKFSYALNQRLPEDIIIQSSEEVALDFHPRYQECRKTYEYTILNRKFPLPEYRNTAHFDYGNLDVKAMQDACKAFIGEHDFAGFCSAGAQVKTTVRTIYSLEVECIELGKAKPDGENSEDLSAGTDKQKENDRLIRIRVNGKILDGTKDMQVKEGFVILTDNDKIEDIVKAGTDLNGYEKVDLKRRYIMPGLINMHVHLAGNGKPQKKQRDNEKLVKILMGNALMRSIAYGMVAGFAKTELTGCATAITVARQPTMILFLILKKSLFIFLLLSSNKRPFYYNTINILYTLYYIFAR